MRYLYKQTGIVVESDVKLDVPACHRKDRASGRTGKKSSHTAKDNEKKDIN